MKILRLFPFYSFFFFFFFFLFFLSFFFEFNTFPFVEFASMQGDDNTAILVDYLPRSGDTLFTSEQNIQSIYADLPQNNILDRVQTLLKKNEAVLAQNREILNLIEQKQVGMSHLHDPQFIAEKMLLKQQKFYVSGTSVVHNMGLQQLQDMLNNGGQSTLPVNGGQSTLLDSLFQTIRDLFGKTMDKLFKKI